MELSPWLVFLFSVLVQAFAILADTNGRDNAGLSGIADSWNKKPSNWNGIDPCGDKWIGITCTGNRITAIRLSSFGLSGTLSGDIQSLSELQNLDLSYNKDLGGPLPSSIGALSNLENLILVGCSFSGEIPKELGQLSKLIFLSLNSNKFSGPIPASLGNLSKLYWFDLADNKLTGGLPVFDGINLGLDNLTNTKHFHFGINLLSGPIPSEIFNSHMKLIHLLLDNNNFSGSIPPTLGLLNPLEVLRFDNNKLTGPVPSNINNLTKLAELHLENNQLTGPLPDLTGMNALSFVDMSNNTFNASDSPAWFTTLPSLTSLFLENLRISGQLPQALFSLPAIQTLRLRGNRFNGTLTIGSDFGTQLQLIDLQGNQITAITVGGSQYSKTLILVGNPICVAGSNERYCTPPGQSNPTTKLYATTKNCSALPPTCLSNQLLSPTCSCAVPYTGTLFFRSPSFSDLSSPANFVPLEQDMKSQFTKFNVPVGSISIHDPFFDSNNNLQLSLELFPSGKIQFGEQDISELGFLLSNQTYKPPSKFGPYFFIGKQYTFASDVIIPSKSKPNRLPLIIGISVGGAVLVVIVLALVIVIARRKRKPRQTEERSQSFVSWDMKSTSASTIPQLRGARTFTFDELKRITNNFSEANDIGNGGYGKVYRGTLPSGQLVAVKRSQQGSLQGSLEFRTEIELLSRVHHKNVVSLVGFCLDQGEQMLVYEYIPNGTLKESLTGKSGVRLDWRRRLRVVLGAAKGIAYLHELADPPIVHRDIKSSNVLLDERLNAKVSDFGLSKPLGEDSRGQVTTQVKGTMGYLDPEYYMTQQLTEKSDVYSFGVLMLEMVTARKPLERGRYVVREVKAAVDRTKDLYGLHALLDPALGASSSALAGLEQYVDLALRCVEEAGADRPSMGEAVGEIERILKMAGGGGTGPDSASNSMSYASRTPRHPYGGDSPFEYSGGGMPSSRVEPK
ncbi:leucine-rich repeat receptor protein kinase HPCA1-like [Phragmites australis]|uniref:leucine-rich repeat receptor protein kinase HPCA1-like n=1 Tax=Phragmites australis TaxID=29695 RepID=UPI002D776473|nr:leucine-rich repeat receptor protein kinase HPCA1-like [Phragmites australis]